MTEIRFYHLQNSTLQQTLPSLLEKAMARGMRALIVLPDQEQAKRLDAWLWSYKAESFLAHGCDGDPQPGQHPIWITTDQSANPNKANLLIVVDAMAWQGDMSVMDMRCEIFNGQDDRVMNDARQNWVAFKEKTAEQGDTLSYWQQGDDGAWQQKQ